MEIQLHKPILEGKKSLEECIFERESIRRFKDKEIELETISHILWSTQGKTGFKRTVPSAGATYPLEIYVSLKNQGLFYYDLEKHKLVQLTEGDLGRELAAASFQQNFIYEASLNIIICAIFSRTCNRYGDRGAKYVLIEVGHCAQNIHLQAVALDLGSVPIGAFDDREVKQVLNLPKNVEPLYIIPIGYPK